MNKIKLQKLNAILLTITVALAALLRTWKITTDYYYTGELGKELLYLRQFDLLGKLPLVGMPTSHEWLNYGPFYYWIMMPLYKLFHGNPFILFYSSLAFSLIGIVIGYFVVKKIAHEKIALLTSIITAVSPLLVWQTKKSTLHSFFFILSPLFMYATYMLWNKNRKWLIWTGIIFGFMFSFHFSQIPLLGVIALLFYIKKKDYKPKDWLTFLIGVAIPNLTFIWQDKNLALWLPYRILSFANKSLQGSIDSFTEYFGRSMFWNHSLFILGLVTFAVIFIHYILQNKDKFKDNFLPFFLVSSISLTLLANTIHGGVPIHYYLPIFTTLPILAAIYIDKLKHGSLLLFLFFLLNLPLYFVPGIPNDNVSYQKQNAIVDFIISDAGNKEFSIIRVGPYDYFPEQYSQNYKYLILWKGGNLVENSPFTYTINDYNQTITK